MDVKAGLWEKTDRRRIDAFELRFWRNLLRIPWTARVSNIELLKRMKPEVSLEGKIIKTASYLFRPCDANSFTRTRNYAWHS